jgi:hypothetical protein
VTLLAEVDRAHERLSGPAMQRILPREHGEYGKAEYARAGISVSHIYNLRASLKYQRQATVFELTRPSANATSIGAAGTSGIPESGDGSPKAGLPQPGQRFGGRQKRGHHTQAHRLWPHTRRTCRDAAQILYGAVEPLSQLPSTVPPSAWMPQGNARGCTNWTLTPRRIRNSGFCLKLRTISSQKSAWKC